MAVALLSLSLSLSLAKLGWGYWNRREKAWSITQDWPALPLQLSFIWAKMHFGSLHFGPIFVLVSKLILLLGLSLKLENRFYFGSCRQPNNRKYIRGKHIALLTCYMLMWIIK